MRRAWKHPGCLWVLVSATAATTQGCTDEPIDTTSSEWTTLVEADWTLAVGDESYTCARVTIPEDMYVRSFRATAPAGTHHTVLSLDGASGPDGTFPCTAATNGQNMLFGSGVGTEPVEFPEGVAIKLEKGSAVMLNLHLYNVTGASLSGRSGIDVQRIDAADVVHEAEIVLAGKTSGLTVPPGASMQTGSCAMSHDVTVFAVFPHMHQLGSHLKAIAAPAGGSERVLVDAPYSFEEQRYYDVDPQLSLKAGDVVTVECHYENPKAETIGFGDSSLEEMCFAGLYRYPRRADSGLICTGSGSPTVNGPPCAKPGAVGNEGGVGRECSEGGAECAGDASLCLADYTDGDFGNFCTKICTDDTACGSGAVCVGTSSTKICIPSECVASAGG